MGGNRARWLSFLSSVVALALVAGCQENMAQNNSASPKRDINAVLRDHDKELLAIPGVALADLNVSTLIASSFLPGAAPRDPVDRILAATAREGGYHLVTRDRRLLDAHGRQHAGHAG